MGFTFMFILKDGWMDGEGMKLWLEKVWSKHPGGLLKKLTLLVCDQFKAHVTESTKSLPITEDASHSNSWWINWSITASGRFS